MKKINNPYIELKGYNCFGCSPNNQHGLKLEFWLDEVSDTIISYWNPADYYQGYFQILHGGVQASLMDEVAGWAVSVLLETGGVTSSMEIHYLKPIYVDKGMITIKAKVISSEKRLASIRTEIFSSGNELCAEAVIKYFVYPKEIAAKKLHYPGIEAFVESK